MPHREPIGPQSSPTSSGVAGAQADFVASIGRRVAQLQSVWNGLLQDQQNLSRYSQLQRFLHALATRARLLRFDTVAQQLELAERDMQRAATASHLSTENISRFEALLRQMPDLVWNTAAPSTNVNANTSANVYADTNADTNAAANEDANVNVATGADNGYDDPKPIRVNQSYQPDTSDTVEASPAPITPINGSRASLPGFSDTHPLVPAAHEHSGISDTLQPSLGRDIPRDGAFDDNATDGFVHPYLQQRASGSAETRRPAPVATEPSPPLIEHGDQLRNERDEQVVNGSLGAHLRDQVPAKLRESETKRPPKQYIANLIDKATAASADDAQLESTPKLPTFARLTDPPSSSLPVTLRPELSQQTQPQNDIITTEPSRSMESSLTQSEITPVLPPIVPNPTQCASLCVLVIGPRTVVDLVYEGCSPTNTYLEVLQAPDIAKALDKTRAAAPDAIVLDADIPGALELCKSIAEDRIIDPTPVIVMGSWLDPSEAQSFVLNKLFHTLEKPVSAQVLGQLIATTSRHPSSVGPHVNLGTLTLDELADRVGQQVRSGLVDNLKSDTRHTPIDLGDGTEVVAAVWSALARIRDVVTSQSKGAIHFEDGQQVSTVPVAPSLRAMDSCALDAERDGTKSADPTSDAAVSGAPGSGPDTGRRRRLDTMRGARPMERRGIPSAAQPPDQLAGSRVIVVDDDPDVVRFVSGLFRALDCVVQVASDGKRALDIAYRFDPDLLVTDILMPELDGFGLCNAFKQDVLLRDVPVVVLSWKEDLLRRVRQIESQKNVDMKQEAAASSIIRTAEKCLRSRTRIEQRLLSQNLVRGRLDGLTGYTLLSLVQRVRPNACITVRNAERQYTVHLRDRRIRKVVCEDSKGVTYTEHTALVSFVRLVVGRFQVQTCNEPTVELQQPALDEVLVQAIASIRSHQRFVTNLPLANLARVTIDQNALSASDIVEQLHPAYHELVQGHSPQHIIDSNIASASLLTQLLAEAAACNAITAIVDDNGTDLLERQRSKPVRSLSLRPSWLRTIQSDTDPRRTDTTSQSAGTTSARATSSRSLREPGQNVNQTDDVELRLSRPALPIVEQNLAPTCLEEAVIRQVTGGDHDDSSESRRSSHPPLLVADLIPRTQPQDDGPPVPSLPPDAIVPAGSTVELSYGENEGEPSVPGVASMPPAEIARRQSSVPNAPSTGIEDGHDASKSPTKPAEIERDEETKSAVDPLDNSVENRIAEPTAHDATDTTSSADSQPRDTESTDTLIDESTEKLAVKSTSKETTTSEVPEKAASQEVSSDELSQSSTDAQQNGTDQTSESRNETDEADNDAGADDDSFGNDTDADDDSFDDEANDPEDDSFDDGADDDWFAQGHDNDLNGYTNGAAGAGDIEVVHADEHIEKSRGFWRSWGVAVVIVIACLASAVWLILR